MGSLTPEVLTEQGLATVGGKTRAIRVLRNGPIRGQIEICGSLTTGKGKPSMNYRLTVELWAGFHSARVDWRLSHQAPGVPAFEIKRASLIGDWRVG